MIEVYSSTFKCSDGLSEDTIVTRHTNNAVEIIVEDAEAAFDPAGNADDNDPHIALNNIKERLKMTCDGKMTIAPRDGGGTSVTVTIPLAKPE